MNRFAIVSDTSHDLPDSFIRENDIKNVSFYVRLGDDKYLRDLVDISRKEFYDFLEKNPKLYPKTSLPSVEDYINAFRESANEGQDIICFTVSSTLSGSYQSANVAAGIVREEYPERTIYVVDGRSASLGVGILIEKAVEMRDKNIDLETVKDMVISLSKTTEVYILLDTLSYLEMGGRISRTGAFAGNLLRLKPIASFRDNTIHAEKLVRGSKRSIEHGLKMLDETISHDPSSYEVFVIHGGVEERAQDVREKIEEKYDIEVRYEPPLVSCAVISHIGPGAIGIGCMKK